MRFEVKAESFIRFREQKETLTFLIFKANTPRKLELSVFLPI